MLRVSGVLGAAVMVCLGCATGGVAEPAAPGLRIGEGGVVLKDGEPFRGMGVNYFSAFSRVLADPNDTSYRAGMDELVKAKIPFARFMACGFWPKDYALYREDKEAFFTRMDGVVKAAEERGLGLIPSLCWFYPTVPDLVGEPCNQWGNPDSKTIAFMRQYVGEVVGRYADSPAIWAWELGNEFSLAADLPNAKECRPPIVPHWGTPETRSENDEMTHDMWVVACREFAKTIRKIDPRRPITTGHSLPRPSAQHQRFEGTWIRDSAEEFQTNLIDVTPDPCDLISVHLYPFDLDGRYGKEKTTYEEILSLCMGASRKTGKALFVGEFGQADLENEKSFEVARQHCLAMIAAIEKTGVPLSAVWVYDYPAQDSFINMTADNKRSYVFRAVAAANERMRGRAL
ncbi:MAG: cellulase family glycosylhydrolase [Nitrospiraceae bacterium]|nr:cellulase family glycosylhydrolase [Nitrospiraceae bacterium]